MVSSSLGLISSIYQVVSKFLNVLSVCYFVSVIFLILVYWKTAENRVCFLDHLHPLETRRPAENKVEAVKRRLGLRRAKTTRTIG